MPVTPVQGTLGAAAATGAVAGVVVTWHNRSKKTEAKAAHQKMTPDDLLRKEES